MLYVNCQLVFQNSFFRHIIVDEAGQATELHSLIPMIGLASLLTRIVLAGDPKQLGPVMNCDYLCKKNIGRPFYFTIKDILVKSLMERYSNMGIYENDRLKHLNCLFL